MKTVVVIDGQGGGCGRSLITRMLALQLKAKVIAVGTNAAATAAMLKAGAQQGATGENAVLVNCRQADIIVGPIGIVMADAMMGECSPAMAAAVAASQAKKVLVPTSRCGVYIASLPEKTMAENVEDAVRIIDELLAE